jgi:hypothetical protein
MRKFVLASFLLCFFFSSFGQTTQDLTIQVNLDTLIKTVRELSGEDSTFVGGQKTIIKHRVSRFNNDLAAQYITEKFQSYGVTTFEHNYRNGGKNILGEIKGKTNPDSIYIICAHYDAVTDYCADDNASGTAAILEAARILSNYCLENTVIFALWDEEERGLIGSKNYGGMASARGDRIKGVFNMDMLGYDSDSNHVFDIHTNNLPHNLALKDSLLYLVDTLNLQLVPQVINPGTNRSDHAAFWNAGYPAVFFGESFLGGDPTPAYHSKNDRINLFNLPYYHNLSILATAVITEYAGIVQPERTVDTVQACFTYTYQDSTYTHSGIYIDTNKNVLGCDSIHTVDITIININDSVSRNDRVLTAFDSTASYQWIDCNSSLTVLFGDTLREYTVNRDGSFAVQLNKNGCKDTSKCFELMVSGIETTDQSAVKIYPNPATNALTIHTEPGLYNRFVLQAMDGRTLMNESLHPSGITTLNLDVVPGMYRVVLVSNNLQGTNRVLIIQ